MLPKKNNLQFLLSKSLIIYRLQSDNAEFSMQVDVRRYFPILQVGEYELKG